jgi:hypothetical protein
MGWDPELGGARGVARGGSVEVAGARFWAGLDSAAEEFGHFKGTEATMAKKITTQIEKDFFGQSGGDQPANSVREGKRMTRELETRESLGKGFAREEVVSDEIP